jgi:hypothetical protein
LNATNQPEELARKIQSSTITNGGRIAKDAEKKTGFYSPSGRQSIRQTARSLPECVRVNATYRAARNADTPNTMLHSRWITRPIVTA